MATITRGGIPIEPFRDEDGRNVYHFNYPMYAPFDPYYRIKLHRRAYRPREMLNSTIKAFYNRQDFALSPRQTAAREHFCAKYVLQGPSYGKRLEPGESYEYVDTDVRFWAQQLDDFFFFGLLGRYVMIETGIDVVGEDPFRLEARIDGETTWVTEEGEGGRTYVRILLNTGIRTARGDSIYGLNDIIAQLMHEMVHAYFLIYSCDCRRCERALLNTTGLPGDGHGPVFLMLHRLILSEIRRWGNAGGNDLSELAWEDCPELCISLNLNWRAKMVIEDLTRQERRQFTRVRSYESSAFHLVRITHTGAVAVRPNIKHRQIRLENLLKDKRIRADEYRVDLLDEWLAYEEEEEEEEGEKESLPDDDGEQDEEEARLESETPEGDD
ncbi:hypothetical protein F5Y00DRAFT_78472 [Daldinia vernicosa]|uniref:uncharacterized protein n=1 Tax=Daldinia vernicosa TaxID=114800 RepID=UPI002007292E|nr:uncharacterized protein F5Y00DRAFT_78472 [Daldinia vernicosa]KAI0848939.1 hypothetical protein F5Y00DRAFT_78472 [Daldinia vernicosa]